MGRGMGTGMGRGMGTGMGTGMGMENKLKRNDSEMTRRCDQDRANTVLA